MAEAIAFCGGIFCVCFIALFAFILSGLATIYPTDIALRYNTVMKTIRPTPETEPGLYYINPFNKFIKYPKTVQTIRFEAHASNWRASGSGLSSIQARTSDGLDLVLGLSFQYKLIPGQLRDLYMRYERSQNAYQHVFALEAEHLITELATQFSAYRFFNDKIAIAAEMERALNETFTRKMCATIHSLQINEDDLPEAFADVVLEAAVQKQQIIVAQKQIQSQLVNFETARAVAYAQANVTIHGAQGEVARVMRQGEANAAIAKTYIDAETVAYNEVQSQMNLGPDSLVKYMWYDVLSGGGVGSHGHQSGLEMLMGVNPAAWIEQGQTSSS